MGVKRKIYFRADAGPEIGYGHYIRSLALADMLKHEFDCTMFTQMPTDYQLHEVEHVSSIVALSNTNAKYDEFLDYLHGDEIVVLDNYFFTTDYQRAIKAKGCKLVCIDDMHDKHYVADMVINHGCTDESLFDVEPYTFLCLGLDYALLRRPFWKLHGMTERIPQSYAICFGGADSHNLTYAYARFVTDLHTDSHVIAIIGDSYQYEDLLSTIPMVEIRKRLSASEMANLFVLAENVICSASTTAYEALACGARVYAGWYVDNQMEIYKSLCSRGAVIPLGDLLHTGRCLLKSKKRTELKMPDFVENIQKAFKKLTDK